MFCFLWVSIPLSLLWVEFLSPSQRPQDGTCPGNLSSTSPCPPAPLHLPAEATPAKPLPSLRFIYSKVFGMNVADLSNFWVGGESSCVPSSLYVHVFHIPGLYSLSKVRVRDLKYLWRFIAKKNPFRHRLLSWQVAVNQRSCSNFLKAERI